MSCRTDRRRVFFALFPTARVRREIAAIQQRLNLDARPVLPEQFHITLAFLGEQPVARLEALRELAAPLVVPECRLLLNEVAGFSGSGVTYLGTSDPPGELRAFREELFARLAAADFTADPKPWRPHVTLYRKMRKPCPRIAVKPVVWPIKAYCLVSSRLAKSGPEYRVLERWKSGR